MSSPTSSNRPTKAIRDMKAMLERDNLRWNWDVVADRCVAHPGRIRPLLDFCVCDDVHLQQNAGAVLGRIIDLDREVLIVHVPVMLANLKKDPHDAVKRATMRVLQSIEIPEAVEGEVFDVAMRYLSDFGEAIAIRAFSMTTARRLCERYPSLRHEVMPVVKSILETKCSPGTRSRAKRELEVLEALKDT